MPGSIKTAFNRSTWASEKVGENFLFGDLKPFPGAAGQLSSLQLASFCFPLYQPGVDSLSWSLRGFFCVFFTPVKTIIFTTSPPPQTCLFSQFCEGTLKCYSLFSYTLSWCQEHEVCECGFAGWRFGCRTGLHAAPLPWCNNCMSSVCLHYWVTQIQLLWNGSL